MNLINRDSCSDRLWGMPMDGGWLAHKNMKYFDNVVTILIRDLSLFYFELNYVKANMNAI